MAQRVFVEFQSDLSGGTEDVSTTVFGLEGVQYEIDLTLDEQTELREALAKYIEAGRRVGRAAATSSKRSSSRSATNASGVDPKIVREWANANNIAVNERGRISADVIEKYKAANGS